MEYESYLSKLPEYDFAITYGSGVFRQVGYSEKEHKNAMLDVIIGVRDPVSWHRTNMMLNPHHYAFFRHFGPKCIAKIEDCGLGHVYYNKTIMGPKGQERPVKYGIIGLDALKRDLLHWDSLYVSGRLQKPVRVLRATESILGAMNQNLRSAVLTVLPLLPPKFTDRQLFLAITGLSYNGDIRTYFAENPHKVQNIVEGNYDHFKQLYRPVLQECPFIHPVEGCEGVYQQDVSIRTLATIASELPASLHGSLRKQLQFPSHCIDFEGVLPSELMDVYYRRLTALFDVSMTNMNVVAAKEVIARGINMGVRSLVFKSSVDQAVRGVTSFGVLNSISYASKKIVKFFK